MDFTEAAEIGNQENVRAMLDADPSLREQHADLVARCAAARNWSSLRLAVGLGFDVNIPTPEGATPLHHAAATGDLEIVQLLVEHGANIRAREPRFGALPAGWAQYFKKSRTQEYLEALA